MWNPLYVLSELLGPEVCAKLGMVLCCLIVVGISVLVSPYVLPSAGLSTGRRSPAPCGAVCSRRYMSVVGPLLTNGVKLLFALPSPVNYIMMGLVGLLLICCCVCCCYCCHRARHLGD